MTDDSFSWSNIGVTSNWSKLEEMISNLRDEVREVKTYLRDIEKEIVELKLSVNSTNKEFLMDIRKMSSPDYDDKSISSFMSLDELGVEKQLRPDEEVEYEIDEDVKVIEQGFVVPPPDVPVEEHTEEGMRMLKDVTDIPGYSEEEAYHDYKDGIITWQKFVSICGGVKNAVAVRAKEDTSEEE